MRLYSFGGILLPEYEGENSISSEGRSGLIILKNGAFDQDGNDFIALPTNPSHKTRIPKGYDGVALDETIRLLRRAQGRGRQNLIAKRLDGSFWQVPAKLRAVSAPASARDYGCEQVITLDFEMSYPFWINTDDAPLRTDEGHTTDEGLTTDAGHIEQWELSSTNENFVIDNTGDMPVPKGVVTITPRSGASVTGIRFTNGLNAKYFELDTTLDDTEIAVVDLGPQVVQINSSDAYDIFVTPNTQVDWMSLGLGENAITVTADSITGIVDITWAWQRHYL